MSYFRALDKRNPDDPDRWTVSDDAPEWVGDAVRDMHDHDAPSDWVYSISKRWFDKCVDPNDDDFAHEFADGCVDIYTTRLAQWYADHCLTGLFADAESEASDCGSFDLKQGINGYLMAVQYFAVRSIAERLAWHMRRAMGSEEP